MRWCAPRKTEITSIVFPSQPWAKEFVRLISMKRKARLGWVGGAPVTQQQQEA
jgi:hypothetical protein